MAAPKRISIILAFAAVYIIWGSTYLAILYAIQSIPPFLMAGARFLSAGLIMLGLARLQGEPNPAAASWRNAFIIGACLLFCGNGGVTLSEKWVPTGLAALIVASVPIDMTLLGWLTGMTPRPTPLVWLGLLGGFVGVGILVGPAFLNSAPGESNHLGLGMAILLVGSFLWSAGSLYSRKVKPSGSFVTASGQQMLCGGFLLFLTGFIAGEDGGFDIRQVSWLSWAGFIYLVLIGALVGYTAYFYLLRHCDPAKVATYAYVNPVVAILLGTALAGERLTPAILAGAGLIIGSVALVITAQQLAPKKAGDVTPMTEPDCA